MTMPATILERRKNPASASKSLLPPIAPPRALSSATSFLLDLVRLTAALLVVAAHLGHPEFDTALPDLQILGDIAVPVFFVLSGFVIRYVTLSRSHTLRQYFIDRAARIYSIALPAMAITLLIAALTAHIAPLYFQQNFAATCDHPFARIALNLTFLSQSWGHNTIPFMDSPFWSLSYEVLFYIAYGLAFYLRGLTRILTLALWTLLSGPQILFLLPIWLLGALVHDLHHALGSSPVAAKILRIAALAFVLAGGIVAFTNPASFTQLPSALDAIPNPLTLLHIRPMRATLFAFSMGIFAALILLLLLLLSDAIPFDSKSPIHPWLKRFRRIADGTFVIYLMHYPLMAFATAVGLLRPNALVRNLTTATIICLLLIALAGPLDRFKLQIRSALHSVFPPPAMRKVAVLATAPKR